MLHPVTKLIFGATGFAVGWKLARWRKRSIQGKRSALGGASNPQAPAMTRSRPQSEVPWPPGRDLQDDRAIRHWLSQKEWFTVTDLARALQNAPPGRKPSGSAGRDARALADRWLRERTVSLHHFGPSGRPFYRFV
jgi:hypothetical protein